MKVLEALVEPKDMTSPNFVLKSIFHSTPSLIRI